MYAASPIRPHLRWRRWEATQLVVFLKVGVSSVRIAWVLVADVRRNTSIATYNDLWSATSFKLGLQCSPLAWSMSIFLIDGYVNLLCPQYKIQS